jgi:cellulose synthase operon protein C
MKYIAIACVLAASVAAAGCSDSELAKKEHFDNAGKFMAAGKTEEAIVEYRNALKEDPRFGEARFKLAEAYEASGNVNQAYREFIRAADLMPANDAAQIKAASYLVLAEKWDDARTRLTPVIERSPQNVEAQIILGNALVELKDLDGAVRQIEEAIKLDPNRATTYSNLAAIQYRQGNRDQAKQAFEKAVEVDPRSIEARLALAYFQWSSGDVVPAEESFKAALAVDAKNTLANRAMAAFYVATRRAPQAEPYLKTLAASGTSGAGLQLADYYRANGRFADAAAVLEPLAKDPGTAGAAEARLAAIAYARNDPSKGHSLVNEVIKREPANVQALLLKAQFLMRENKLKESLESARAATSADPGSVEAHFFLGTVYDRLQMRKDAIGEFTETVRLNPRATAAQLSLSRLTLLEGAADSAITFAEGALNSSPGNPVARASLVRGLLGRRDTVRAEQELATLLKQYPEVGLVHALDGALKIQKKDVPGARAAYERAAALTPDSVEVLAGLTGVDLLQNKAPQALARLEARLAKEPDRVDYLLLAAQVHGAQREFGKAEASLRKAIENNPSETRAYSMLAAVLLANGKLDAARVEFDRLVERNPRNLSAQTMGAMILHAQNKTADAKKRYAAIVNANPTAAVAANNLAWMYAEDNENLDEALRLAQGAVSRAPDNPEVHDTLGWVYYQKQLPVLAITSFERAIEKGTERNAPNPAYQCRLALARLKSGDSAGAQKAAEEAVAMKPDYGNVASLLARPKC